MMSSRKLEKTQFDLVAEFGKYVLEHPEVLDQIPNDAHVYFEVAGEVKFNRMNRQMAERQRREEPGPIVFVRTKGLARRRGSRLIDPVIETVMPPARKKRQVKARTSKA